MQTAPFLVLDLQDCNLVNLDFQYREELRNSGKFLKHKLHWIYL